MLGRDEKEQRFRRGKVGANWVAEDQHDAPPESIPSIQLLYLLYAPTSQKAVEKQKDRRTQKDSIHCLSF